MATKQVKKPTMPEINEKFFKNWEDAGASLENLPMLEELESKLIEIYNKEDKNNRDYRLAGAIRTVDFHKERNAPRNYGKIANDVFKHMRANIK